MSRSLSEAAYFIQVKDTPGSRSWPLFIGLSLWREIGSPAYVSLLRRGNVVHIAPATSAGDGIYTVISCGGTPRISVGRNVAREEFRLFPGVYRTIQVRDGEIIIYG